MVEPLIFDQTMLEVPVANSTGVLTVKATKAEGPIEDGRTTTMATLISPEAVAVAGAVAVSVIPAMATGTLDVEVSVIV